MPRCSGQTVGCTLRDGASNVDGAGTLNLGLQAPVLV